MTNSVRHRARTGHDEAGSSRITSISRRVVWCVERVGHVESAPAGTPGTKRAGTSALELDEDRIPRLSESEGDHLERYEAATHDQIGASPDLAADARQQPSSRATVGNPDKAWHTTCAASAEQPSGR